ncbi:uncharacterized protein LOC100206517 isoform X1 [Hydra vulgaris]|uniref:uncharacterized protein LOC100206517 isoform X1 n=1 Tax=Hydra vulgaris TaxID=6087 RepID=UPI0032EA8979
MKWLTKIQGLVYLQMIMLRIKVMFGLQHLQKGITYQGPQGEKRKKTHATKITASMILIKDKDVEDDKNIYVLPSAKQEAPLYPRSVSPSIQTTFVENILNVEEDIDKLRKENMLRWRNEKNRWREYSLQTQQCNLESLVILKNAFTPQLS